MKTEEFMNQKAKDMGFDELLNAMKIKLRESKSVAKPKEEFPIVFKGYVKTFMVFRNGGMDITENDGKTLNSCYMVGSLPLLYKAVEKSKQLWCE